EGARPRHPGDHAGGLTEQSAWTGSAADLLRATDVAALWKRSTGRGARRWGADSLVIAPWDVEHYSDRAASGGLRARLSLCPARQWLRQYEIAPVQTTAIEPAAGMVNLTTMLTDASGEWIASDWSVCPVAETAHPQQMGAALTYARRYGSRDLIR